MKRVLLALVLVGCGSQVKKPDAPPTPTEREPDASVATNDEPAATQPVAPTPPTEVTATDLEIPPKPASSKRPTQAQIAWDAAQAGIEHMKKDNYEEASSKFRDAVARMPEPAYFFNLCFALYQQGRFGEALVACHAVETNSPTPKLETKAKNLIVHIKTEASRQGIKVE
jgi:TolA-binding protein